MAINSSSPLVSSEAEVPQPTPATLLKPCRQGCNVQHFYFRRMLMTTLLIITQNITCHWRYDNHSNKSGGPISKFEHEGYHHVTSRREPLAPCPSHHLPLCEQVFWLSRASPSTSRYRASTLNLLALHLESFAVATLDHNPEKLNN